MGSKISRRPSISDSTTAWPRFGISWGFPTIHRTSRIRTRVTNQLVTMLLVTGRGPSWNNTSAFADTPPSAADGGQAETRRKAGTRVF